MSITTTLKDMIPSKIIVDNGYAFDQCFFFPWTLKVPVNPVFPKSFTGIFLRSRALFGFFHGHFFLVHGHFFSCSRALFKFTGTFFSVHGHFFRFTGTFLSKLFTATFSRFMGQKNTGRDLSLRLHRNNLRYFFSLFEKIPKKLFLGDAQKNEAKICSGIR